MPNSGIRIAKNRPIARDTRYLIHYGELGLKGANRRDFETRLKKNISKALTRQSIFHSIEMKHRYYVLSIENVTDREKVIEILHRTFGISWFTVSRVLPAGSPIGDISQGIIDLAMTKANQSSTFRITAKRADKRYPLTSPEIEKHVGANVLENTPYTKTDLTQPDHTYYIEINHDAVHIYTDRHSGPGGLPVGSSGRVLTLLSGGFDSPVASYLMAKRGCSVDFLHFYVGKPGPSNKITRLATQLATYTGPGKIYLAPYLPFNLAVTDTDTHYELVLFRRFMLRIAELICHRDKLEAIVTGDSLGQVASQTIQNISATNDALDSFICFRPLIGMDKSEIISLAERIGTAEISKEPDKDCCSLIDRHAKTRVTIEKIADEEGKLAEYDTILNQTMSELGEYRVSPAIGSNFTP